MSNSNLIPNTENEFVFFGYEVLFSRVGLDLRLEDMTIQDEANRIKEIKQIYKDRWGYENVLVKKDRNDPYMALVYVKPNKPFGINYYKG